MSEALRKPTDSLLRVALGRFDDLLAQSNREADYQQLFAEFPFILSRSLPMSVANTEIRPLARPGRSDPDFVIYPRGASVASAYGVIELKRPDSRILRIPRRGILTLADDAKTAVAQARVYGKQLERELVQRGEQLIFLGRRQLLFVIMGLSDELTTKLTADLYRDQLQGLLPGNCRLIPYDTLRDAFGSTVPPKLIVVVPALAEEVAELDELVRRVDQNVYYWELFEVAEPSFEFWEWVEASARACGARHTEVLIDRSRFSMDGTRRLATETDSPQRLSDQILALIEIVARLAGRTDIAHRLDTFVRVAGTVGSALDLLSRRQRELLLSAVQERAAGVTVPFMQLGDPDVEHLTRMGLVRLATLDSGETYYHIHPLVRFAV